MTFLEILLLLLISAGLLFSRYILQQHWQKIFGVALSATAVLHLFVDGYRWQMTPAYLLMGLLGWRLYRGGRSGSATWKRIALGSLLGLFVLIAWLLPTAMPVFELPKPGGAYAIGTQWLHLTDSSRAEVITPDPLDKRELLVKLWYPAGPVEGLATEGYLTEAERVGLSTGRGLPAFATSHLANIQTHVYPNAPNAAGSFPVLIFSHGYESAGGMYYSFLSELASHGYMIAHVYHTHETIARTFPDGRVIYVDDSASKARNWSPEHTEVFWKYYNGLQDAKTDAEREQVVLDWVHADVTTEIPRRWASDLSFVLDQLEQINENRESPFYGRLDVAKVGVFGHSIGGSAAGQVLLQDKRFLAGINLDGLGLGDMIDKALPQPFMVLSADREGLPDNINPIICRNKSEKEFYYTYIKDTWHGNFSDAAYWLRYRKAADSGSLDPDRAVSLINQLSLAFFDYHIKGFPNRIMEISDKNSELRTTLTKPEGKLQLTAY
ncbi:hypothetical protein [Cesiribacter sp. SM1]|uniref:alpha/beta hydrolase family protein n=1 Tax=Cesiribacter sp. SM1 TaxID=2861196 RepID=UPI001CD50FE5|nr:hypothetical protein [Cesiribacter sp. SM1]